MWCWGGRFSAAPGRPGKVFLVSDGASWAGKVLVAPRGAWGGEGFRGELLREGFLAPRRPGKVFLVMKVFSRGRGKFSHTEPYGRGKFSHAEPARPHEGKFLRYSSFRFTHYRIGWGLGKSCSFRSLFCKSGPGTKFRLIL